MEHCPLQAVLGQAPGFALCTVTIPGVFVPSATQRYQHGLSEIAVFYASQKSKNFKQMRK